MNTKPYTRADVEMVEKAIRDVTPPVRDGYVDGRDLLNAEACAVLDALAAAGRLPAEHHLPLLDLTADEIAALIAAANCFIVDTYDGETPVLRSALDKLTTTEGGKP